MMNYKKYTRQYFMPPERCMDWADKEYVDEVIRVIREINPDIKPFPSAGISKGEDCYNIIKAGASASGCSSAIAKAENPLALAEEMIAAVRRAYDENHK